jgi:hypothetical protein
LAEALRYKPEGRQFDSGWDHWDFSLTWSFWLQYGPGVGSVPVRFRMGSLGFFIDLILLTAIWPWSRVSP